MTISWQAKIARWVIGRSLGDPDAPIAEQRAAANRMAKLPHARSTTVEEIQVGGIRCLRLTPTRSVSERHMVYIHGGGYALMSPETHLGWVQLLAVRANATTTMIDYRLAPEHPYPAAIDDCVAVVRGLYAAGLNSHDMVLAGDSAGGGASLSTLCRLRDAADPLPAGVALFSPWTDLTASGDSVRTRRDADPMIDADALAPFAEMYRGQTPADDPGVSPLFADLTGLPPTLIQVGDDEVLLDDSVRLDAAMRAVGVEVELDVADQLWHVYQAFGAMVPEARAALVRAAEFLATCTRQANASGVDRPAAHSLTT